MSYVIMLNNDKNPNSFFVGWSNTSRKVDVIRRAVWTEALKDSRHWEDKTNCKRFIKRNIGVFCRYNYEIKKLIPVTYCLECNTELDKDLYTRKKFCDDKCRFTYYNNKR